MLLEELWVSRRSNQPNSEACRLTDLALKIVQIASVRDGDVTPIPSDAPGRRKSQKDQMLGKGPGGVGVTEVVNLWRGSMAVGKGVNDVDWGAGGGSRLHVISSCG
jgi:hypothetical protein